MYKVKKRKLLSVTFLTALVLVACEKNDANNIAEIVEHKEPLSFSFTANYEEESEEGNASLYEINNLINSICFIVQSGCGDINKIRRENCIGDIAQYIADAKETVVFNKMYTYKKSGNPENERSIAYAFAQLPLDSSGKTIKNVELNVIENMEQKLELKQIAFNAYTRSIIGMLELLGNPNGSPSRCNIYKEVEDSIYMDVDPEHHDGPALLEQTFASLPTLVKTIKDIKYEMSEMYLNRGISLNDEWSSEEYGRIPAIRQLYGTIEIINNDLNNYKLPEIEIYPNMITNIPEMTNRLNSGIYMVSKFIGEDLIDYFSDINVSFDENLKEIKGEILERANEGREEEELPLYTHGSLTNEYGITESDYKDTIKYMYTHMYRFPRLPSIKDEDNSKVVKWSAAYKKLPWFGYTWEMDNSVELSNILFKVDTGNNNRIEVIDMPKEIGLFIVIQKLQRLLIDGKIKYEQNKIEDISATCENIDPEKATRARKVEDSIINYLDEAEEVTKKYIGNEKIETNYFVTAPADCNIEIRINNCDESKYSEQSYVRAYSFKDSDTVDQWEGFACSTLGDKKEEPCKSKMNNVVEKVLEKNNEICAATLNLGHEINETGYMIEIKETADKEWIPLMSSSVKTNVLMQSIDGEIVNSVQRLLQFDENNQNETDCDIINGLNDNECLDKDWVPSIDNELIDTTGNQYEESYRHYLNLARIAADKAKNYRNDLINDIINEAHDESIEEAKRNTEIDLYYKEIEEICGDNVRIKKEDLREIVDIATKQNGKNLRDEMEKLWGIDPINENIIEHNYGCENGVPRKGMVQCAIERNCDDENPFRLWDIIPKEEEVKNGKVQKRKDDILKYDKSLNDITRILTKNKIKSKELEKPYPKLFDIDAYETKLDWKKDTKWQELDKEMLVKKKKLELHKSYMSEKLLSIPIYHYPNYEYDSNISGKYFEKEYEIENLKERLRTAYANYLATFDKAIVGVEHLRNMLWKIKAESDLAKAQKFAQHMTSLMSYALSKSLYTNNKNEQWDSCIDDVRMKYDENYNSSAEASEESVEEALRELNRKLEKDYVHYIRDINDKGEFEDHCRNVLISLNNPALTSTTNDEFPKEVCSIIADNGWGNKWAKATNGKNWAKRCGMYKSHCHMREKEEYIKETEKYNIWIGCYYSTFGTDKSFDFDENIGFKVQKYKFEHICKTYDGEPGPRMWYYIDKIERSANEIWRKLKKLDSEVCETRLGCKIKSEKNWTAECDYPMADSYDDIIDKEEILYDEIDRLTKKYELATIEVERTEFLKLMIEVANEFTIGKNEIKTAINEIAGVIAGMSRIENEQINIMNGLINGNNEAKASSYSSLTEWNDRYNYRKEIYKEQLKRARTAAWIARRAIEFRFGIDLSTEETQTIHGDIPKEWADDIYISGESKCLEKEKEIEISDTEGNEKKQKISIAECLKPEERIEEYVQKLEDYVESYGNTPEQEWWFHEDDDTSVISLRDNIAVTNKYAEPEVYNLLFFTEEMDMSEAKFEEKYVEIVDRFREKDENFSEVKQLLKPSFWNGNVIAESSEEIAYKLGMPSEILIDRRKNEKEIYEDQKEENTAEYINIGSANMEVGEKEILQEIETAEITKEKYIPNSKMAFTAYMKKMPLQMECKNNEIYSEMLDKCGEECNPEENITCPYEGQECTFAGYKIDVDDDKSEKTYICTWCSADRACMEQDGTVVRMAMAISDEDEMRFAEKNVSVENEWKKNSVNTISDTYDALTTDGYRDSMVKITNAETKNIVSSSERNIENKWELTQDVVSNYVEDLAPDKSNRYEELSFYQNGGIGEVKVGTLGTKNNFERRYTGSVWIKNVTNTDEKTKVKVALERINNELNNSKKIAEKEYEIGKEWQRIELSGLAVDGADELALYLKISEDIDKNEWSGKLGVWGFQIEEGSEATIYIPTGKNYIPSITVKEDWQKTPNAEIYEEEEVVSPRGRKGTAEKVYRIEDKSSTNHHYIQYEKENIWVDESNTVTFSIWMKMDNGTTGNVVLYLESEDSTNTIQEKYDVDEEWQRYSIKISSDQNVLLEHAIIRIYPSYISETEYSMGNVLIWGPQLENGSEATGYQEMVEDDSNIYGIKKWDAEIGLVGTSLINIESYACDELGNQSNGEEVEVFECASGITNYVRNTYSRLHYPEQYEVVKKTDSKYPLPDEISGRLKKEEKIKLFKAQFIEEKDSTTKNEIWSFNPFGLNIWESEAGGMGMYGLIAADNFNYRIRTIAVNMVGTDIIDCNESQSPTTCAANNWISYDLTQLGDVRIRNHSGDLSVRPFKIQNGKINGGKAWVAEQVIGYPISNAHQSMMKQVEKVSLMGRPINGIYDLKIYGTPEINWNNVEDIQIVLGYHYWSRAE